MDTSCLQCEFYILDRRKMTDEIGNQRETERQTHKCNTYKAENERETWNGASRRRTQHGNTIQLSGANDLHINENGINYANNVCRM